MTLTNTASTKRAEDYQPEDPDEYADDDYSLNSSFYKDAPINRSSGKYVVIKTLHKQVQGLLLIENFEALPPVVL